LQINKRAVDETLSVRGVNKHQIKSFMAAKALQVASNVPGYDGRLFGGSDFSDIPADQIERHGILINEDGMKRSAAQSFDSHGAGAGIKIKNTFRMES
jgi:hypothetical protein